MWILLALATLVLPVVASYVDMDSRPSQVLYSGLATMGIGVLSILFSSLFTSQFAKNISKTIGSIVFFLTLLVHLGFLVLVLFSGHGFGPELFAHTNAVSVAVVLSDYLLELLIFVFIVAISITAYSLSLSKIKPFRKRHLFVLGFPALLIVGFLFRYLPAWDLYVSWKNWARMSEPAPLNVALVKPWQDIGIINQLPPRKGEIQATRNASSTNLVLVYLESFNLALLSHPDWPGLAPGVANLQDEHGWEHPVYSSATVTVEGIANSQCGTLVPFFQGNDSLASGSGLGEELPCMADVLRSAGYYQVYMGGAKVGFAGKGEFLRAHGFDEVLGWEHWKRRGLERNGAWGLSDIQLFDQATRKLEELQERELPFNLTLLTIGTHIPGQSYQECQPYGDGQERFLNAVHCTDQLLSRWVKEITEKGLLENTTLIVTADHGVFDNFAMRQVFGEMTKDTRLPFIIIGDSEPGSVTQAPGASVDLPATILDLLEIDTNANFLVGNSLLRGTQTPEYFLSRYMDIDAYGNIHHNNAATCEHDGPVTRPSLPLDSCEKRSLLHALKASMDSFSQKRQQVFCQSEEPLSAWVNDEKHQVSIKVSGLDQVPKFSREGAAVDVGKPGIWALGIEPTGHILSRRFYLASEAEMLVESIQSQPETIWLLVVDLSDNPPPLTSALKNIQLNSKRKAIALVASDGRVIEHASALLNDGLNFSIGKDNCLMVFSNQ